MMFETRESALGDAECKDRFKKHGDLPSGMPSIKTGRNWVCAVWSLLLRTDFKSSTMMKHGRRHKDLPLGIPSVKTDLVTHFHGACSSRADSRSSVIPTNLG